MMSWWSRRSLRSRLAAWYAIGSSILLAVFSGVVYWYVGYTMAAPLDRQLRQDLAQVRADLRFLPDGSILWRGVDVRRIESWPARNPWFEIWDDQGKLVRRFWPFVESRLEQLPVAPARGRETISVFNVSPDIRLRVLSVPLESENVPAEWMIRVMSIHEPAMNALRALLLIIGIALPVVVFLLVIGGYAVTRRWLHPLDSMVTEANEITANDLGRRLTVHNPHDELGRLATVFNTTLARLEDSFVTLDRFVADASHELLTPLTSMRSVGEVGLRGSRTPEDYREVIGSMLEEMTRLQILVEKLLQLARAEGGAAILELSQVSLTELIGGCADDAAILAEEKQQRLVLEVQPETLLTDPLLLRQALQNLLDNAIKYSPPGSLIGVMAIKTSAAYQISVLDRGSGVSPEYRQRLTDRFFRADASRKGSTGGYGLGLAITKAYMHALGGTFEYRPNQPSGSVFTLVIPRPATSGSASPFGSRTADAANGR